MLAPLAIEVAAAVAVHVGRPSGNRTDVRRERDPQSAARGAASRLAGHRRRLRTGSRCAAGAPGIYSARYAGEDASDEDNLRKLLAALAGASRRHAHGSLSLRARVSCARRSDPLPLICQASWEGRITERRAAPVASATTRFSSCRIGGHRGGVAGRGEESAQPSRPGAARPGRRNCQIAVGRRPSPMSLPAAARSLRAHALVRAQVPVLRLQLARGAGVDAAGSSTSTRCSKISQIDAGAAQGRPLTSIFFGGGTPSLFAPDQIGRLLDGVRARHRRSRRTSRSRSKPIPAPSSTAASAAIAMPASIACRSARKPSTTSSCSSLGRIHGATTSRARSTRCASAGIDNFNLDLMYGLPAQTLQQALADLDARSRLQPAHISHYQLTLEPGTVFYHRPPPLPDPDDMLADADAIARSCSRRAVTSNTKSRRTRERGGAAGTT